MVVHEPASIEAPEAQEVPVVDPIVTEDIAQDDVVLPQIERPTVSLPVPTNSELISIGRPLTSISQKMHRGLIAPSKLPHMKTHEVHPSRHLCPSSAPCQMMTTTWRHHRHQRRRPYSNGFAKA